MRRSALLLFMAILAGATGIALLAASLLLVSPSQGASTTQTAMGPISAYLSAVNRVLQTGDATALDAVLADDFVEQGPAAVFGGDHTGLARYLLALRATYSDIRVTLEDALTDGTRVSLHLTYQGQRIAEVLGATLPRTSATWTTVDVFRIEAGKIAEHWANDAGIELVQPVVPTHDGITIAGADVIAVARLRPLGATIHSIPLPGAAVVVVEDGSLTAQADASWRVVPAMNHAPRIIPAGQEAMLRGGDVAVLPANAPVIQMADPRSSFLVVAAIPPQAVIDAVSDSERDRSPVALRSILDALRTPRGAEPVIAGGVAVERLAIVNPRTPVGTAISIALNHALLPPGATLDLSGMPGSVAVAVESGKVDIAPNHGGPIIQRVERPGDESPPIYLGEPILLRDGDAAIVPAEPRAQVTNAGAATALVLLVTLTPDDTPSPTSDPELPAPTEPVTDESALGPR